MVQGIFLGGTDRPGSKAGISKVEKTAPPTIPTTRTEEKELRAREDQQHRSLRSRQMSVRKQKWKAVTLYATALLRVRLRWTRPLHCELSNAH